MAPTVIFGYRPWLEAPRRGAERRSGRPRWGRCTFVSPVRARSGEGPVGAWVMVPAYSNNSPCCSRSQPSCSRISLLYRLLVAHRVDPVPTVAQKCRPVIRRSRSSSRWIRTALFPFRKPTVYDTLSRWDTRGQVDIVGPTACPSSNLTLTPRTTPRKIRPTDSSRPTVQNLPAVLGMKTTWSLQVPLDMRDSRISASLFPPAHRAFAGGESVSFLAGSAKPSSGRTARGRRFGAAR